MPTPPALDPPFSRIGIVGLGLIGGSIALRVRHEWPAATVIGLDRGPVLAEAKDRYVIHRTAGDLADLVSCDLIVLAVPLAVMLPMVTGLARMSTHAIVTDVASTKRNVMASAAAASLTSFVGGHPMAGRERSGLRHATADLFDGRPWLLVEGQASAGEADRVARFVTRLGARPQRIDAEAHDRAMAYVSHLPQLMSVALMNAAAGALGDAGGTATGPAFAEMTRLASSSPDLWQGILAPNADFVREALSQFIASLPAAADVDREAWVHQAFTSAGAARARWRNSQSTERKS